MVIYDGFSTETAMITTNKLFKAINFTPMSRNLTIVAKKKSTDLFTSFYLQSLSTFLKVLHGVKKGTYDFTI